AEVARDWGLPALAHPPGAPAAAPGPAARPAAGPAAPAAPPAAGPLRNTPPAPPSPDAAAR
ncbi:hypothetical protein, partial [Kitasatospora sp. A2-31]